MEQSLETISNCESTMDDSNLSLEQSLASLTSNEDNKDIMHEQNSDSLENNCNSLSENMPVDNILEAPVSIENTNCIENDAVSHIEKSFSQFELKDEKHRSICEKYPMVLLHSLNENDMPTTSKIENEKEVVLDDDDDEKIIRNDDDIEMEEVDELCQLREEISKMNAVDTIEAEKISNSEEIIINKDDSVELSSQIKQEILIKQESTEEIEMPKAAEEEEEVTLDVKEEPKIEESINPFENFEDDFSYLRRSRRLKSVYVENPTVLKLEDQQISNNFQASEVPELILVQNTSPTIAAEEDVQRETNLHDDEEFKQRQLIEVDEHIIKEDINLEPETKKEDDPTFIDPLKDERLSHFITIKDNIYCKASDKVICKINKTMKCDCTITEEDIKNRELGCTDNCINRLLFIECSPKCRCGEFCDNQQFQRHNYSPIAVFRTDKKGFGIRADADIPPETFLIEYVGEVLNNKQFEKRAGKYSKQKNRHYYFMALRSNAIIDATVKGNISRFINHSCDPNAMTQKWTINGELRVGFFSIRYIKKGEEITFDYQYQRYGKEAQKCYCESSNCRGWIGENPMSDEELEGDVDKNKKGAKSKKIAVGRKQKLKLFEGDEKEMKHDEGDEAVPENEKHAIKEDALNKLARKPRKQFHEDLEIDDQIKDLIKSGLKNRAHTIVLARLIVRAKSCEARNSLLKILIDGDLPCRRLFLDYNGLRLLHNWMCDINVKNSVPDLHLCIEVLYALELLPITNKTVLRESKVLERVEKWKNLDVEKRKLTKEEKKQAKADKRKNKMKNLIESMEVDQAKDESSATFIQTFDVLEELPTMKLIVKEKSTKLLQKWEVLKEDFRIPKKQKQEIMKEHEKEAGMEEEIWNEVTDSQQKPSGANDRFKNRFGKADDASNFRNHHYGSTSSPGVPSSSYRRYLDPLERQQRRQQFERRMAQIDYEKRMMAEHENNCAIFGLQPNTPPTSIPVQVNRVTGEYYNILGQPVPPPPNHHTFKYEPLTLSTNPDDYHLPPIDLPEQWCFAIDKYGRIYYYHEKIRQPQWEPPIKIQPLAYDDERFEDLGEPDSDESTTDTEDSEEEELKELLELLKRKKRKLQSNESNESHTSNDINSIEEDLEKKIMNNMIQNPTENSIKLLPTKAKRRSRKGLITMMKFIRPRTEQDKLYGRSESKRYKEVKEKLRRQKKKRLQQKAEGINNESDENIEDDDDEASLNDSILSKRIVDELDILSRSRQIEKNRKIKVDIDTASHILQKKESLMQTSFDINAKQRKPERAATMPSPSVDTVIVRRQFRDDIKDEIKKYLFPYRSDNCVNGRITTDEDYISLVNKVSYF